MLSRDIDHHVFVYPLPHCIRQHDLLVAVPPSNRVLKVAVQGGLQVRRQLLEDREHDFPLQSKILLPNGPLLQLRANPRDKNAAGSPCDVQVLLWARCVVATVA